MLSDSRLRPALKIAIAFALGICLVEILPHAVPTWFLIASILFFSVFALVNRGLWRIQGNLAIYLAIAAVGALLAQRHSAAYSSHPLRQLALESAQIQYCATALDDAKDYEHIVILPVKLESVYSGGKLLRRSGKCLLAVNDKIAAGIKYGDRIAGRGQLEVFHPPRNPGRFDLSVYYRRTGILARLKSDESPKIIGEGGFFLLRELFYPLRRDIMARYDRYIGGEEAELIKGLTLGVRQGFSEEFAHDLRGSGLWHLVSLSGMHIGMAAGFIALAMLIFRVPANYRVWGIIAGIAFYLLLAEARTPMVRAAVIISLALLARPLGRYTDKWNLLAVSALIILLFRPMEVFSPGFQLSFAATAFILAGHERIFRMMSGDKLGIRPGGYLRNMLGLAAAAIAAILGTAPFLALHFGIVPLSSILGNIPAVPLTGIIFASAPVFYIAGFLSDTLAGILGNFLWGGAKAFEFIVHTSADLPLKLIAPGFSTWTAILFVVPLWLLVRGKRSWVWTALLAANVIVWKGALANDKCLITFLDVGQGNCAVVQTPDRRCVIIDAGRKWRYVDSGEQVIAPFLEYQGVKRIDRMILTHHDIDHIGGYESIRDKLPVEITMVGKWDTLRYAGVSPKAVEAGSWMKLGGVLWLFLNPVDSTVDDNDRSIVTLMRFGESIILFPGDISAGREEKLSAYEELLEADVLLVSHHGSRYSSGGDFLHRVSAEYAVISCGRNNYYGHPAMETLERLRSSGTEIFRTDIEGAVGFIATKDRIILK